MRGSRISIFFALALTAGTALGAARKDDTFLMGYASAVIERELGLTTAQVSVSNGVVSVRAESLPSDDVNRLIRALREIEGVVDVVVDSGSSAPEPGEVPSQAAEAKPVEDAHESEGLVIFPERELFDPLLADPRWPHFSVTYQRYLGKGELRQVGAPTFGEMFAILSDDFPLGGRWELDVLGSIFSIFDLDAESFDLVNSDFVGGLAVSYRMGSFSSLLRVFHQSSHLGDEFLLRNRIDRINLSYEAIDAVFSYEFLKAFRVYGGGGYIFHREPSDLDPLSVQGGVELRSPWSWLEGLVRPVAAVDVHFVEENEWEPDLSVRAGLEFARRPHSRRIQLLLEYFDGRSPNGQFFRREIEYLGIGVHFHF